MADLFIDRGQGLVRMGGFPPHEDRFQRSGFDLVGLLGSGSPRAS
jgi:pilus assembly protein CpaF